MATGKGGGMSPQMMQQMMAQQMGRGGQQEQVGDDGISTAYGSGYSQYPDTYLDMRNASANRWSLKAHRGNPSKKVGVDTLQEVIHKSKKKNNPIADITQIRNALFAPSPYSPNFTPLHDIVSHPYWDATSKTNAVRAVLEFGADPNQSTGFPSESILTRALNARYGEQKSIHNGPITALVNAGADVNKRNLDGENSLHLAVKNGNPSIMPMLVASGAKSFNNNAGASLSDLAIEHFSKITLDRPFEDSKYEEAFDKLYVSFAYIKKYKLHSESKFDFNPYKEKLLTLTKHKPSYIQSIERLHKTLNEVEVEKPTLYGKSRLFTNPHDGLNDTLGDHTNHPWLGWMAFVDRDIEKMQRERVLYRSEQKTQQLFNNLSLLEDPKSLYMRQLVESRKEFSLDYPALNHNSEGDTLLTKALKEGKYEAATRLIELNVNMHAVNNDGDTGLHVLAKNCTDRTKFLDMLTKMIGTPDLEKEGRISLFDHGNHADFYIRNNDGKTFMEVLQDEHPSWQKNANGEWPADCWFPQIEAQLGIKPPSNSIPEWSLNQGLLLSVDAPQLELKPLPENPLPSEKNTFIQNVVRVLTDTKRLELKGIQDKDAAVQVKGERAFFNALNDPQCDLEVKVGVMTSLMASQLDDDIKGPILDRVTASFKHEFEKAPNAEKEKILNLYNTMTENMDNQQLASQLIIQHGILSGSNDQQNMGTTIEDLLRTTYAKQHGLSQSNDNSEGLEPGQKT